MKKELICPVCGGTLEKVTIERKGHKETYVTCSVGNDFIRTWQEWKELQKKWGTSTPPKRKKLETLSYSLTTPPGRETQKIAS